MGKIAPLPPLGECRVDRQSARRRVLHLDDLHAQLGQQPSGQRPRPRHAELEHPRPCQVDRREPTGRGRGGEHRSDVVVVGADAWCRPERHVAAAVQPERLPRHLRVGAEVRKPAPEAPHLELRLVEHVHHRPQVRGRDARRLQRRHRFGGGAGGQPLVDAGVDLTGAVEPLADHLQTRVGKEVEQLHGEAQRLPLLRRDRDDRDEPIGAAVQRHGMRRFAEEVPPPPLDAARVGVHRDRPLVQGRRRLHRPDVDELTLPRAGSVHHGRLRADRGDGASQVREPRSAALQRLAVAARR